MIDLVYIFGKGSQWQNNELRYSLRSVQENLQWYHKVFLVGNGPKFLSDKVIQIPQNDSFNNKQRNIMAKIYAACSDERISENFLLFNDDYFLLKPTDAVNYPYYYDMDLIQASARYFNSYKKAIDETLKILESSKKPIKHFDIHRPIIYNKALFIEMCNSYNWNVPFGYTVKSMYCNHFNIEGEHADDLKINYPYKIETLYAVLENKNMFSIGDKSLNTHMKSYLTNLFPTKSKFENGKERYQQSAMFNQVINSLARGTDPLYIIDQILKANDNVHKEFEKYAMGDTRPIVIHKSDNG